MPKKTCISPSLRDVNLLNEFEAHLRDSIFGNASLSIAGGYAFVRP